MKNLCGIKISIFVIIFYLISIDSYSQVNFNVSAGPVFSNFDINDNDPDSKTSISPGYEVGLGVSYSLGKIKDVTLDVNFYLSNNNAEYIKDNEIYAIELSNFRNEFNLGFCNYFSKDEDTYLKINYGVYLKYTLDSKLYHKESRISSDIIDFRNLKEVVPGLAAEIILGKDKLSLNYGIAHDIQNSFSTGPISLKSTIQTLKLKFYF